MKKLLAFSFSFLLLHSVACASNETPVQLKQLPKSAQTFLATHFAGVELSYALLDNDILEKDYTVVLVDGTKMEFDKKGNWEKVERKAAALPLSVIPAPIQSYLAKQFAGQAVHQISKDRMGYEVKIANGLEVKFDPKFQFIGLDD